MRKSTHSRQTTRRRVRIASRAKRKAPRFILTAAFALFLPTAVKSATLAWYGDGVTQGGSGPWDTTSNFWDNAGFTNWSNAGNHTALFGGTASGTVTLSEPITAGSLLFNTSGYTITGNTLTLATATGSTSPVIRVGDTIGQRAIISSLLAGTSGFTKTGNGTLQLTNSSSTISGDVVIKAGTVVIDSTLQLGSGTTAISVTGIANTGNPGYSGGSLMLTGGMTLSREVSVVGRGPGATNNTGGLVSVGNNTVAGGLVIGSGASQGNVVATHGITTISGGLYIGNTANSNISAAVFQGNGNFIVSGRVSGNDTGANANDDFIKTGTVYGTTLWLQNATNSFNQALRIDSGTVRIADNGALGINTGTQAVDLQNATLEIRTDSPNFGTRNLSQRDNTSGGLFVDRAIGGSAINQTVTFARFGRTTGTGGTATFSVSGRNGYNTTFSTLFGAASNQGTTLNNNSNGLVTYTGDFNLTTNTSARTLAIGGNGETLLTGSILATPASIAHSLTKSGTGTFTIQGAATTAGGTTTISDGTLSIGSFSSLPTNTNGVTQVLIGNATTTPGALSYTGPAATPNAGITFNTTTAAIYLNANGTGALTLNGPITNSLTSAKTLVLGGTAAFDNTIAAVIPANNGTVVGTSLQKIGTGTWVLAPTANNTFVGTTTVSNGTLKLQEAAGNFDILPDAQGVAFNVDAFTQASGGTLSYLGASGVGSTETVGALTLATGGNTVSVSPGAAGSAALTFASLGARTAGATLNLVAGASSSIGFTAGPAGNDGIIGGFATFNGVDWVNSGVAATQYVGYTAGLPTSGSTATVNYSNAGDVTTTAGQTINSLKLAGTQTITLGGTLTVDTGGVLFDNSTGAATITGSQLGATNAELMIHVNGSTPANALTINSLTGSGTSSVTKAGTGVLILGGSNVNTGTVTVNAGTVQVGTGGTLAGTNAGLMVRQGATLDLNGSNLGTMTSGGGNALNGAGTITNTAASTTSILRVGNGGTGGYFSGVINDGAGKIALSKGGAGTLSLSGTNTFSGGVRLTGGTLAVTSLANIGVASGIGTGDATDAATNAASLIFDGGTLTYTGATTAIYQTTQTPSVSINRLFTLAGNGTISSEGSYGANRLVRTNNNATLIFNNTDPVAFSGAGARTLTLQGDSIGDNQINLQLVNNGTDLLNFTKAGTGMWILGNATNSYTGTTSITGGALRAQDGTSLPSASNLLLNGGVFESTGTFNRTALGTAGSQFRFGVFANSGFSSGNTKLTVDLSSLGTPTWGSTTDFLSQGQLLLNSTTSIADVEVAGNFDVLAGAAGTPTITTATSSATITVAGSTAGFTIGQTITGTNIPANSYITAITTATAFTINNNATVAGTSASSIAAGGWREVNVQDNTSTNLDFATISGVIGGTGGLAKIGVEDLILGNNNTYSGKTVLRQDGLYVTSIGASGATASSLGTNVGGGVLEIGNPGAGTTASLMYVGPGETVTRQINITGTTGTRRIDNSGSGPLILTALANSSAGASTPVTGARTLELRGTNTDGNMVTSVLGNDGTNVLTVTKADGGMWILNPGSANTFTGALTAGGGTLGITANAIGSAAGGITLSNGSILAFGGPLTTSAGVTLANNTTGVFAGTNAMTFNGTVTKVAGANDQTVSNNLEGGALLTFNGNFTTTENTTRTINWRGYGSTVWNGVIANGTGSSSVTAWNIAIHPDASWTFGGTAANTYSGVTTLSQGTLILNKSIGLAQIGNGTSQFNFGGGVLQSNVGDLTAANALANNVFFTGDPATFGATNWEFTGNFTNNAGNRLVVVNSNLTQGTGVVNLSENTSNRILTFLGSGVTTINGVVTNTSSTSGATGSLTYSGTGSLVLTGANTATGTLTANRGTVTLEGAAGRWTGSGTATTTIQLNAGASLTLNNATNENLDRIFDSSPFVGNGGTLNFIGDGTSSTESFGTLLLNNSQMPITMAGAGSNTLTFAAVNFANTGSSLDLSSITSLGTNNKIIFTSATGVTLSPTTTGIASRIVIGSNFATYNATDGVRSFTNYNPTSTTNINAAGATDTVEVNAGMTTASLTASKTINALKINGTGLTVGGAALNRLTLTAAGILNTGGNNTLSTPEVAFGGNVAYIQVDSGTTLNVNSFLSGTGSWSKSGAGTMVINTPSFLTGTQNINAGTLQLNAGTNTLFPNQLLNLHTGATLDLNGNTQYFAQIQGAGPLPGGSGNITNTGGGTPTLITNAAGSTTFGGQILDGTGVTNFARVNGNTLTFEMAQPYSGSTLLMGGTLALENDATLLSTSTIDLNYATLSLNNNSSLQTSNNNRIGDSIPLAMRSGAISYTSRIAVIGSETFGALTLDQGANSIAIATGGGTFGSASATFASLTRNPGTTISFNGGTIGQQGNNTAIMFASPLTAVGSGVLGAWAIANSTDYAAYNTGMGIGIVGTGGYTGYDGTFGTGNLTEITGTANVTTTLPTGTTNTALLKLGGAFQNDILFTNGSDVLNLELGGILRSNNNNASIFGTTATRGVITSGTSELVVFNNATGTTNFTTAVTTSGSPVITGIASTVGLTPGMTITNANLPAGTYVVSVDSATQVTVSQNATAAATGQTLVGGTSNVIVNSVIQGSGTSLVKSGAGVLNLSANNTYTGGTVVSQGTVNLIGSGVVIPAGGITLTGASLIANTNAGQIDSTNAVTLNGSSTLTNVGNGTLASLTFNNNGGTGNPTVNSGGILTLTNATPIIVSSSNPFTVATIAGSIDIGTGPKTLNIPAITVAGDIVSDITPTLNISANILSPGVSLTKSGAGILQLGGQSTFTGGLTFSAGGIVIGGNSTPTQGGAGISSGPLGGGAVAAASGTTFLVDGTRTIGNDVAFAGTPTFDATANVVWTLTLNGELTGAGLAAPTPTVQITNPFLTVALRGTIPNITSITSFTKTGLGTLVFNATGYTGDFNASLLGNPTAVQLLHDGNTPNIGNGVVETIALGNVIFDAGVVGTVTVDRAGGTLPFGLAANKIIAPSSINTLGNGLTVINSNGYGLQASDTTALTNTPTFNVGTATASNVTQGLYLTGLLSGTGFNKTNGGTLVLGNASNSFTGDVNIQQGVVSISANGQLGAGANLVRLNPTTGTSTLRATNSLITSRVIQLSNTSFTRAIEVVGGQTLQLDSAFDLNTGAGATAGLTKADNGTLTLNADNSATGYNGVITVTQGALNVLNALGLGTATGNTVVTQSGAAVRLTAAGGSYSEPFTIAGTGILTGGALEAVSAGSHTTQAPISLSGAAAIGANSGTTLNPNAGITSSSTTAQALTLVGPGAILISTGTITTGVASITKIGTGTTTLQTASNPFTGALTVNRGTFQLGNVGSGSIAGTSAITVNQNGVFTLDNTTSPVNRYGNRPVALAGGTFNYNTTSAAPFTDTSSGALTFNSGASVFNMSNGGASTTTVVFGSLAFGAGGTGNITGLNTSSNLLKFTTTPALTPATTGLFARLTVNGTEFAAYNGTGVAGNGVVAFTNYAAATNILSAGSTQTFRATPSTANSLASSQTLNALTLSSGGSPVNVGGLLGSTLTLTSGGILANGSGSASTLSVPVVAVNAVEAVIHVASGQTLDIDSGFTGTAGMTKALNGTLDLNVQQYVTGTTTVNGGTLNLNAATNTLLFNNQLTVNTGGTVNLGSNVQFIGNLVSSAAGANTDIGGGVVTGSGATLVTNANSSFGGDIQGSVFLNKAGTGTLTLTNAQSYTGGTLITGGGLTLVDSGSILNTTGTIGLYGGSLTFTNSGLSDSSNRVGNNAIDMRAGTINYAGRAATVSTETLGAVTLLSGLNNIFTDDGNVGVDSADLTFASITRSGGSSAVLRFNNLGDFGLIGTRGRVMITSAPTLVNNIIGPWAIVDREYASYDSTYGVGGLTQVGFAGYAGSGLNTNPLVTDNVRFAIPAGTTFLEGNTVVNTLNISQSANSTLDLGGFTLRLQGGGLLIGQNTDNTTQTISNGTITSGTVGSPSDLYLIHAPFDNDGRTTTISAVIADNAPITGPVRLILSGGDAATSALTLTGANTYTGGTVINQGTRVLGATGVLGTGGITVDVATFTQTLGGVIPSQQLTLNGGSVVTLANQPNTLTNLVISNNGGAAPTLTPTGTLTLTGNISTSSISAGVIPTIGAGTIDLNGNGSFSLSVGAATVNGQAVAPWQSDLTINSVIQNGNIVKTGSGNLLLAGQNTFGNLTVNAGGLIIGANSVDSLITSGPAGTGTVTMANGTSMLSAAAAGSTFTITNNVIFGDNGSGVGTSFFNGVGSLTLGGITTLPATWNATVTAPQMTVTISDANGAPSVGTDVINKSGLGTLNVGNYNGTINVTGGLLFTADGNTLGTAESLSLGGNVVIAGGTVVTVNRSGSAPNARNKTIQKVNLSIGGDIISVANLNGYGLEFTGTTTLTGPANFAVGTASVSNVVQGLTLTGAVDDGASDFGLIKSGPGTLVLSGTNTFGGAGQTIDILNGVVSVNSDAALGHASNTVTLNVDASTAVGLRATGTFSTGRTIVLNQANNALEATAGSVLTITAPFSVPTATNTLTKNDNGVVEITADNTGWTGAVTINAGALRAGHGSALGSGAVTINNAIGSALQLTGGVSINNPITIVANGASGFDTRGAIESVSGNNTIASTITQTGGSAVTIGAGAGATLNINGGIASGNSITFAAGAGGTVNLNSVYGTGTGGPTFAKIGPGAMNITVNQTMNSTINVNNGTLTVTGSGVTLGSVGAININAPGTLSIDDSVGAPSAHMGNRQVSISAGTFTYTGNASNSAETNTSGLSFLRGGNTFIVNPAGGATSSLTFSTLSVANDTSIDFQGTGLGGASNKLLFTNATTVVLVPATTGILSRATVNGSTFATYGANGIAGFTAYNAATSIITPAATDTVDVTSAMTTTSITASKTINAIRFSDAAGDTIGGSPFTTLTVSAGGFLATGGGSNVINVPILTTGSTNVQPMFHVDGASTVLTIDSAMTTGGGLVKAGAGTLVLSPNNVSGVSANTATGNVTVAGGRLRIDSTNAIIPNQFLIMGGPGSEFDLFGNSQQFRGIFTDNAVDGAGGIITSTSGTGSLVINQDNNARSFAGSIQGSVNVTRSGENTLSIYTAQSYSGTTLINGNTTVLRDGGTLSGTGALDINYATLSADNNAGTIDLTDRINNSKAWDPLESTCRHASLSIL